MKSLLVALTALLLAMPLVVRADLYEQAEAAFSRGAYPEAIKNTEQLLKKKPTLPAYLYLHAMSALRARDYRKALGSFKRLVGLPDDAVSNLVRRKSYANYMRTLLATKKLGKAQKVADEATRRYPDDAMLANLAGRVYLGRGKFAQAVTTLQHSIELDDDNWSAYNNLGLAHLKAGSFGAADAAFSRAIAKGPPIPYLYNNRGGAREKLGGLTRALADYRKALKLNPGYAKARRSAERVKALIDKRQEKK